MCRSWKRRGSSASAIATGCLMGSCPFGEIELERWADVCVDAVTFNFDKYAAPRFQVQLSRRSSEPPHAWVRSANLVRRPSQYLHFWGKPWWLPATLWSEQASRRVVARVESLLAGALAFVDQGERGRHISRRVGRHRVPPSQWSARRQRGATARRCRRTLDRRMRPSRRQARALTSLRAA